MQKLLAVYVGIPMFCVLAFAAFTPTSGSIADQNISKQMAECVLSALQEQERARQANQERFVREASGIPMRQLMQILSMAPPPPTAAEAEHARNEALVRIKEICRLRDAATG
jgi:hypothetical protein